MASSKITEKEQALALKTAASLLVTQPETIDGKDVEALRRVTIDKLAHVLRGMGFAAPLLKTESGSPALIWPEEDSPLRPVILMDPIQGGSGDPYPPGYGKNKLNFPDAGDKASSGITWSCSNGAVTASGTATANAYSTANNITASPTLPNGAYKTAGGSSNIDVIAKVNGVYYGTGEVFTIDDANTLELVCCRVRSGKTAGETIYPMLVSAQETDLTYAPYSNVRPISGRNSVTVTRSGKNLLPTPYTFAEGTFNGITITKSGSGGVMLDGTATQQTIRTLREKMPLPGGKYILSGLHDGTSYVYAVTYHANGERDTFFYATTGEVEFVVPDGGTVSVNVSVAAGDSYSNRVFYPMLRLASDADAAYEPYRGETFTLGLGRTVYGGTLDAAGGLLTVTHRLVALKDLTGWYKSDKEAGRFVYTIGEDDSVAIKAGTAPVCSVLPGGVWNTATTPQWTLANNNGEQFIVRTNLGSTDEWMAWLNEHDPQACYELRIPQTAQIDSTVIPALGGMNVVMSTGDGMTLTYNKSLVREHEELYARLAALEAAVLNNA